jgi:hypothetical protein
MCSAMSKSRRSSSADRSRHNLVPLPSLTLWVRKELFAEQTAAQAQSRALLFYPQGRVWARKGYFLFARGIADSPV